MADGGPRQGFFDLWSRVYDAPFVQRLTYRPGQDAVLRELRDPSLRRVLDVGCGTGILAARIARELAGRRVTGCDFSAGMLRHAAARSPGVGWIRADAQRLPVREASFDALVSTEAFHWFPDPAAALGEFHRVLAPGGRLVIVVATAHTEWLSRVAASGSRLVGEPLRWPTRGGLRRQLERAGFVVESQRLVPRLPAMLALPSFLTRAVRR